MPKPLNIAMIGYGFMGRAHSNAYCKVNHFFDLEYRPVLKAICARDEAKAKDFAAKWGYESVETDWRMVRPGFLADKSGPHGVVEFGEGVLGHVSLAYEVQLECGFR